MPFNHLWSSSAIAPTASLTDWGDDTEHLMAVETLFPKGIVLDM